MDALEKIFKMIKETPSGLERRQLIKDFKTAYQDLAGPKYCTEQWGIVFDCFQKKLSMKSG